MQAEKLNLSLQSANNIEIKELSLGAHEEGYVDLGSAFVTMPAEYVEDSCQ